MNKAKTYFSYLCLLFLIAACEFNYMENRRKVDSQHFMFIAKHNNAANKKLAHGIELGESLYKQLDLIFVTDH